VSTARIESSGRDHAGDFRHRLVTHLETIYPRADHATIASRLITAMRLEETDGAARPHRNLWSEADVLLITYGDFLLDQASAPLQVLKAFIDEWFRPAVTAVHVLPFFPYSSDDGFAVMDYVSVNESLGDWRDMEALAGDYRLMADLVLNHCSSRSAWFENFKQGIEPGRNYFRERREDDDVAGVVRPRSSPLFTTFRAGQSEIDVWCTFGPDQVDFDFGNPDVLVEFARIIRFYLDRGIRILRLDAVAFLWKESGTSCLNLPQTHELVRLLRTMVDYAGLDTMLITETNIPNRENLAYFGNANEAHAVYNFSLPPLLINTLLTGDCRHLKNWLMSMPPAQNGTCYLNFIASHDGIGLRPVEGLLADQEIDDLIFAMRGFGGLISARSLEGEEVRPYEINISLYDALSGTLAGADEFKDDRFICAHAIMLALEGIPAFYIHSLLATGNDYERVRHSRHNRHINRHRYNLEELSEALSPGTGKRRILDTLLELIRIRKRQPAFHPNAVQFTLHLGDRLFAFWRQSTDRRQSIFCINNISAHPESLMLSDVNLVGTDRWRDLISGDAYDDHRQAVHLAPYRTLWISNTD
jgi:sucrose phosphorylase